MANVSLIYYIGIQVFIKIPIIYLKNARPGMAYLKLLSLSPIVLLFLPDLAIILTLLLSTASIIELWIQFSYKYFSSRIGFLTIVTLNKSQGSRQLNFLQFSIFRLPLLMQRLQPLLAPLLIHWV